MPTSVCDCMFVCVFKCVFIESSVSHISLEGGITYRGQCFPEFYTLYIFICWSLFLDYVGFSYLARLQICFTSNKTQNIIEMHLIDYSFQQT